METFPMLAEGGGYEILRAGQRTAQQLMVIAVPPGGYTVTYLKSTIASAKGYVRPLQRDIVLKSTTLTDPVQSQVGGSCHTKLLFNVVPFSCVPGNKHTNGAVTRALIGGMHINIFAFCQRNFF